MARNSQTKDKNDNVSAVKKPDKVPPATITTGDHGKTVIQHEVVAKIAGLAIREIEGVHKLVSFGAGQAVASITSSIRKNDMKDLGVRVEVGEKEAAVDARIVTKYGASIPGIAEAIRKNVTERIEQMTGLKVVEVNVDVVDLFFASGEEDHMTQRVE